MAQNVIELPADVRDFFRDLVEDDIAAARVEHDNDRGEWVHIDGLNCYACGTSGDVYVLGGDVRSALCVPCLGRSEF